MTRHDKPREAARAIIAPDVRKRFIAMLDRLNDVLTTDPERGQAALRNVLGERITLLPDESGKFLWADYSLGIAPLLQNAGVGADLVVAGA